MPTPTALPAAPTAAPVAPAALKVDAVFPAGTLLTLRGGLRTQAAIDPKDLSLADLQRLVVTLNGQAIPTSEITFDPPTLDDLQQIVIRFTVAGRQIGPSDALTISLPSKKLVLWGKGAPSSGQVTCNVQTTAEWLIRSQAIALGKTLDAVDPVAVDRIASLLINAMTSSTNEDPTTSDQMTYAVDKLAKHLIDGNTGDPSVSIGSITLDRPTTSGGGGIAPVVVAAGTVTTLAGSGVLGAADGIGTAAQFNNPRAAVVDPTGTNLYIGDGFGHLRRKVVLATGEVTTLAGDGTSGTTDGTGAAAGVNIPSGLVLNTAGTILYVADAGSHRIRQVVVATGAVTTLPGAAGGGAAFTNPTGMAIDASGTNLYVTAVGTHRVYQVTIGTGAVSTLAGSTQGFANSTGGAAQFDSPGSLALDATGTNLYVADTNNHRIRQIVVGTGVVTTLAGSGVSGSADGTGALAQFATPRGVALDGAGNLCVAQSGNGRIRKVVIATGVVTTLAGSTNGYTDGTGSAAQFSFGNLFGLGLSGSSLYVPDSTNRRIRKVTL